MKHRDLFYKADIDGKYLDNFISFTTKIKAVLTFNFEALKYNFSHYERWTPDENGDFVEVAEDGTTHYLGWCFTSTTRGGQKGVVMRPASQVLIHPGRWKYFEYEVNKQRWENIALLWLIRQMGKGYDYAGAMGCVLWQRQNPLLWFCSEIGMKLKQLMGEIAIQKLAISPIEMAAILAKMYGEPKELKGE